MSTLGGAISKHCLKSAKFIPEKLLNPPKERIVTFSQFWKKSAFLFFSKNIERFIFWRSSFFFGLLNDDSGSLGGGGYIVILFVGYVILSMGDLGSGDGGSGRFFFAPRNLQKLPFSFFGVLKQTLPEKCKKLPLCKAFDESFVVHVHCHLFYIGRACFLVQELKSDAVRKFRKKWFLTPPKNGYVRKRLSLRAV